MNDNVPRYATLLDHAATGAAILVLPIIFVESTVADPHVLAGANVINWLVWLLFLADSVAKTRLHGKRYLRSWTGVLDIAVIVVSLPGLVAFLESARMARLLRLGRATRLANILRMARMLRYGLIGARLLAGLRRSTRPDALPFVLGAVGMIVLLGGGLLYTIEFAGTESLNLGDAIWWAMVTVTTVGYGDIAPSTNAGRFVASGVMLVGIAFTSLLTAEIATWLSKEQHKTVERNMHTAIADLDAKLDALREDVANLARGTRAGWEDAGGGARGADD